FFENRNILLVYPSIYKLMCITRVGKVISLCKPKATVKLVGDSKVLEDIDVSMVDAELNSYVEVYANLALAILSTKEANSRRRAWLEVMRSRI
ncbi:MAG: hypothetical protein M1587_09280, partial [Thaumarchaeota archaeon]|nr:hypothetical protein [Nitrososphaerota archaeon]